MSFNTNKLLLKHSSHSKFHNQEGSELMIRNLMNESVEDILATYTKHEKYLAELYQTQIKQLKKSYKPRDIPDMTALDIISPLQFQAMISFLEQHLVQDAEKEHNYSDIFFDLLIPEWSLAIFRQKFQYSRIDALNSLRMQS